MDDEIIMSPDELDEAELEREFYTEGWGERFSLGDLRRVCCEAAEAALEARSWAVFDTSW